MTKIRAGTVSDPPRHRPGGIAFARSGPSFGGILSGITNSSSTKWTRLAAIGYRTANVPFRTMSTRGAPQAIAEGPSSIPIAAQQALQKAMSLEGVPASWQSNLQYIMARESGGNVGVRNPRHSARGLYQLTAANYRYNPRGTASFGNAVEEAQGGIRYIRDRYKTAANAVAFWRQHSWY